MLWLYYIGGKGSTSYVTVKVGLSADPETHMKDLAPTHPFELEMLAVEEGNSDLLEERKKQFRKIALKNDWYKAKSPLMEHIEALPKIKLERAVTKKVCVDLTPEEWHELQRGIEETDSRTKSRLMRKALKFYLVLGRYRARGYILQVLKGGRFQAFTDLDHIVEPEEADR